MSGHLSILVIPHNFPVLFLNESLWEDIVVIPYNFPPVSPYNSQLENILVIHHNFPVVSLNDSLWEASSFHSEYLLGFLCIFEQRLSGFWGFHLPDKMLPWKLRIYYFVPYQRCWSHIHFCWHTFYRERNCYTASVRKLNTDFTLYV